MLEKIAANDKKLNETMAEFKESCSYIKEAIRKFPDKEEVKVKLERPIMGAFFID